MSESKSSDTAEQRKEKDRENPPIPIFAGGRGGTGDDDLFDIDGLLKAITLDDQIRFKAQVDQRVEYVTSVLVSSIVTDEWVLRLKHSTMEAFAHLDLRERNVDYSFPEMVDAFSWASIFNNIKNGTVTERFREIQAAEEARRIKITERIDQIVSVEEKKAQRTERSKKIDQIILDNEKKATEAEISQRIARIVRLDGKVAREAKLLQKIAQILRRGGENATEAEISQRIDRIVADDEKKAKEVKTAEGVEWNFPSAEEEAKAREQARKKVELELEDQTRPKAELELAEDTRQQAEFELAEEARRRERYNPEGPAETRKQARLKAELELEEETEKTAVGHLENLHSAQNKQIWKFRRDFHLHALTGEVRDAAFSELRWKRPWGMSPIEATWNFIIWIMLKNGKNGVPWMIPAEDEISCASFQEFAITENVDASLKSLRSLFSMKQSCFVISKDRVVPSGNDSLVRSEIVDFVDWKQTHQSIGWFFGVSLEMCETIGEKHPDHKEEMQSLRAETAILQAQATRPWIFSHTELVTSFRKIAARIAEISYQIPLLSNQDDIFSLITKGDGENATLEEIHKAQKLARILKSTRNSARNKRRGGRKMDRPKRQQITTDISHEHTIGSNVCSSYSKVDYRIRKLCHEFGVDYDSLEQSSTPSAEPHAEEEHEEPISAPPPPMDNLGFAIFRESLIAAPERWLSRAHITALQTITRENKQELAQQLRKLDSSHHLALQCLSDSKIAESSISEDKLHDIYTAAIDTIQDHTSGSSESIPAVDTLRTECISVHAFATEAIDSIDILDSDAKRGNVIFNVENWCKESRDALDSLSSGFASSEDLANAIHLERKNSLSLTPHPH